MVLIILGVVISSFISPLIDQHFEHPQRPMILIESKCSDPQIMIVEAKPSQTGAEIVHIT